jgi:acetamidase/formamidase
LVKRNLDTINNIAAAAKYYEYLSSLKTPLNPFLGSIGVVLHEQIAYLLAVSAHGVVI